MKIVKMKFAVLLCFTILGCSINRVSPESNSLNLNSVDKELIKNAINMIRDIMGEHMENNYVINPYFESFTLDYSKDSKDEVLNYLGWDLSFFQNVQTGVNKKHQGKFSQDLFDMSNCNESNAVFYISGISDRLILVKLIENRHKYVFKDLKNFKKSDPTTIDYFALILGENKSIDKIVSYAIHYD